MSSSVVLSLEMKTKTKTRFRFASVAGSSKSFCAWLISLFQRREHVRQPATGVVEMPIVSVAVVNCSSEHCEGLITDASAACQINKLNRHKRGK